MRERAATPILFVILLGFASGIAVVHGRGTGQSPAHDQPASEEERARLLAKGKELFVERCARCHNERGEKPLKTGPPLNERGLSAEVIARAVSGRLRDKTEDERRAVTLYISSLMKTKDSENSEPLLSALATPSFSLADLRSQITTIVVGFILLVVGIGAAALFFFRSESRDLTLIYFSLFSILYAIRLLLRMPVIRSLSGVSDSLRQHIDLWITVILLIPFLLFLRQVLGPQIKTLVRVSLIAQAIFAAVAITADAFGGAAKLRYSLNNYLVLAIVGGLIVNFLVLRFRGLGQPWTPELRVLTTGLLVFGVFVLHGNLNSLGLLPGPDVEALGFLFFVGCLGYVAAHRTFANEHRLHAINKELEIARQIQSSILPREVPSIAGLEIAARYLPMSAVAGDFYDFLVLESNQLGVLVADVTGHGVPAALIASMLKGAFAGQKAHAQHPELVLVGLNEALCGKFEAHFVTAAYLYADLDAKILRYAGAGHPPLLLGSHSNGGARFIEQNGLQLGMFPEAVYSSIEIPLQQGDRYVLFTDGLPESTNAKEEEFGLSRCKQFLGSRSDLSPLVVADALLSEIARWSSRSSGRLQQDDMTLIVIDCQGKS